MDSSVNSRNLVSPSWTSGYHLPSNAGDFLAQFDFGSLLASPSNPIDLNRSSSRASAPSDTVSKKYDLRDSEPSSASSPPATNDNRTSIDSRDSNSETPTASDHIHPSQAQDESENAPSEEEVSELSGAIAVADQLIQSAISQEVVQTAANEQTTAVTTTQDVSVASAQTQGGETEVTGKGSEETSALTQLAVSAPEAAPEVDTTEIQSENKALNANTVRPEKAVSGTEIQAKSQATNQQKSESALVQFSDAAQTTATEPASTSDLPIKPNIAQPTVQPEQAQNQSSTDSSRRSRAVRRNERSSASASGNDLEKSFNSKFEVDNRLQTTTTPTGNATNDDSQFQSTELQLVQTELTPFASEVIQSAVTDTIVPNIGQLTADVALDAAIYDATLSDPITSTSELKSDSKQSLWQSRQESGNLPSATPTHETNASNAVKNMNQTEKLRLIQRVARSFSRLGNTGGTVQLRLHPPELGALAIQVRMEGRSMAAHLTTQSAATREVIMESLPQLRQRLAEQGFEITQFTVDVASDSSLSADTADSNGHQPQNGAPLPGQVATDLRRSNFLRKQLDLRSSGPNLATQAMSQRRLPGVDLQA